MSIPNTPLQAEHAAYEALDEHCSTVGEHCIRDGRAPTTAETDRFNELDAAFAAAIATRVEADRARKQHERMLEGRGY